MSRVLFISDLHLGHKRIMQFSPMHRKEVGGSHDRWLIDCIKSVVTKRDRLYILGDVILSKSVSLDALKEIPGDKILVRGNHDDRFNASDFLSVFVDVLGITKYKGFWISHAPVHPNELRGCKNIHGHVHTNSIRDHYHQLDDRYINVCVEALEGVPIGMQEIINGTYQKIRRC